VNSPSPVECYICFHPKRGALQYPTQAMHIRRLTPGREDSIVSSYA
jgi:hypothetical protein